MKNISQLIKDREVSRANRRHVTISEIRDILGSPIPVHHIAGIPTNRELSDFVANN